MQDQRVKVGMHTSLRPLILPIEPPLSCSLWLCYQIHNLKMAQSHPGNKPETLKVPASGKPHFPDHAPSQSLTTPPSQHSPILDLPVLGLLPHSSFSLFRLEGIFWKNFYSSYEAPPQRCLALFYSCLEKDFLPLLSSPSTGISAMITVFVNHLSPHLEMNPVTRLPPYLLALLTPADMVLFPQTHSKQDPS